MYPQTILWDARITKSGSDGMDFPTRLRELRKGKNVSQTVLANNIGVVLKQVQRYEAGQNDPTLSVLLALADFFDVSLDYLVGRSNDPRRLP